MKTSGSASVKLLIHEALLSELESLLKAKAFTATKEGESWLIIRMLKLSKLETEHLPGIIKRLEKLLKRHRSEREIQDLLTSLRHESGVQSHGLSQREKDLQDLGILIEQQTNPKTASNLEVLTDKLEEIAERSDSNQRALGSVVRYLRNELADKIR